MAACGSNAPSLEKQANQVAAALEGLATDPVALVSSKASAEARKQVAQLFVPGSKVSPDVRSWAPDGPDRGTMVVTVEAPDQDPQTIIVIVILEDSAWKITEIVPEEPPASPGDPPKTGLVIKPTVFESIGQPPEVVEEKAGRFREVQVREGYIFVFGDYMFRFSDSTGVGDLGDPSGLRPDGVCIAFQGELQQIVDSPSGTVSITDLDALFGQAWEWIEPEEEDTQTGWGYGAFEYRYEGNAIVIGFSEGSDGEHFEPTDPVLVRIIWEADVD